MSEPRDPSSPPERDELHAARWDPEKTDASFRRPFPWLTASVIVALLAAGGFFLLRRSQNEVAELRAELVRTHSERIGERALRIRGFRNDVETMILRAAALRSPDVSAPGFTFESLRGRPGVYVRLREADAASRDSISRALEIMEPDAIAHCFGLTPVAMRTLYTKCAPLTGQWLQQARELDDALRLRVRVDEIRRYAERDLPALESISESEYLLLTIVRGESRARDEVDVYLFDARTKELRFGWNTRANGYLLTARIAGYSAPSPSVEALARSGATDCSIAAQARTRTGEFGAATGSGPLDAGMPDAGPLDGGFVPLDASGSR